MKVQIVKYLNPKGKVVEMRKDNFKGRYLPENIIEEYEVEIKGGDSNGTSMLEDLKRKYESGNYILLWKANSELENPVGEDFIWTICNLGISGDCWDYKLIHLKHKDILDAYLKNPSVKIETGMFAPMTGETEPSKWVDLEKDFIEDYNEEFWYRLKVKDLAWYEEKDNFRIAVKQIKSLNDYIEKDGEISIMEKITDDNGVSFYTTDGYHTPLQWLGCYRPATESEALSLVYNPQQKVSKEKILVESNRLKDLFLNNKAECLVENEQEFKLVYNFLDKTCDKSLNRRLELDGSFDFTQPNKNNNSNFPIMIAVCTKWGNIFEWVKIENRFLTIPIIKFDGETFSEVVE